MSEEKHKKSLIAGALAGMVSDLVVHPVDTIRTRLQTTKQLYTGFFDAAAKTVRNEGVGALYKGLGIVLSFSTVAHALYFGTYELSKKVLQPTKKSHEMSAMTHFTAGLVADLAGALVWTPMDVVKQRLQIGRADLAAKYKSSFHGVRVVIAEEGVKGLYRGFGASFATFGPFVGLYFMFYEAWKKKVGEFRQVDPQKLRMIDQLSGAFFAGALASFLTNPLDVVKTNMQVYSVKHGGQKTAIGTLKSLVQDEGFLVLGKGMSARIMWIAPGTAITMAAYEQFYRVVNWVNDTSGVK